MSTLFPSLRRSSVSEKPFQDTVNIFGNSPKSPSQEQIHKYSSPTKTPSSSRRSSCLRLADVMNTPGKNLFEQEEDIFEKREDEEETASEVRNHLYHH